MKNPAGNNQGKYSTGTGGATPPRLRFAYIVGTLSLLILTLGALDLTRFYANGSSVIHPALTLYIHSATCLLGIVAMTSIIVHKRNFKRPTPDNFNRLADLWQKETIFLSNSETAERHPAHREIVSWGPPAVPLILERMRSQGGHWFTALTAITGDDPIPPGSRGKIPEMTAAWLEWGRSRGHISE